MPLNLVEKTVACLVSEDVSIWHYMQKPEGPRFCLWVVADSNPDHVRFFETMEEMVEAAYDIIDPLKKTIPTDIAPPPEGQESA